MMDEKPKKWQKALYNSSFPKKGKKKKEKKYKKC